MMGLGVLGAMGYAMSRKPPSLNTSALDTTQAAQSASQSVATEESVQRRQASAKQAMSVLSDPSQMGTVPTQSSPLQAAAKRSVLG